MMPEGIGPILVEGPVEVVLPDGRALVSERPVVALCTCRRSRRYPFCDTSHRRHGRPQAAGEPAGEDGSAGRGVAQRDQQ
jgi:CDGSH-type Zn-finger protein